MCVYIYIYIYTYTNIYIYIHQRNTHTQSKDTLMAVLFSHSLERQQLISWCLSPLLLLLSRFSHLRLCATPEMAAHQAPLSLGFSRQEHWSGLPFSSTMHESEKWKGSRSVVSDSSWPHGLQPTRLLHPWDFPGKSTGVGCHCLLGHLYYELVKEKKQKSWDRKAGGTMHTLSWLMHVPFIWVTGFRLLVYELQEDRPEFDILMNYGT